MAVDPLKLYTEELQIDDIATRLATVADKTKLVARALGPADTTSKMLPAIDGIIDACPDDELLAALAVQLGELRDMVAAKGDALPLLEKLCKVDETVVREAAVASLRLIGDAMTPADVNASYTPLLKRLLGEAWWTCKVSAAGLLPIAYAHASDETALELKASLMQITKDEAPMVRRSVASNLGQIAERIQPELVTRDILPCFNKLANDDQDSVRILAFGSCIEMCTTQTPEACASFIYPAAENFSKDSSWRVRLEVAKALHKIAEGVDDAGKMPVRICAAMLKDVELDVRRVALEQVHVVIEKFPADVEAAGIVAAVAELAEVDNEAPNAIQMKVLLAVQAVAIAKILGQAAAAAHVVPLLTRLVQEDATDVRISVLENFSELVAVAGADSVVSSFPLQMLSSDTSWRVRRCFLEGVPALAGGIAAPLFTETILPLVHNVLTLDQVAAVRAVGGGVLASLGEQFGPEWVTGESGTVKIVSEMCSSDCCFTKISGMQVMTALAQHGASAACEHLAQFVVDLARDKVPNVRVNAAWAALALGQARLAPAHHAKLKAAMTECTSDADGDVSYFAGEAVAAFG